jgi:hypothetical protein
MLGRKALAALADGVDNTIMQLNDALEADDWQIVENVISDDLEPLVEMLRKVKE